MAQQHDRQYASMMAKVYNWLTEYQSQSGHEWFTFGVLVRGQNSGFIFQGRGGDPLPPKWFYVEILRRYGNICCISLRFDLNETYEQIDTVSMPIGWRRPDDSVINQYRNLATAIAPNTNTNQRSTTIPIVDAPASDEAAKESLFKWLNAHAEQLSDDTLQPFRIQQSKTNQHIEGLIKRGFLGRREGSDEVFVPDTATFASAVEKTDGNDAEVKTIESDSKLVTTIKALLEANLNVILTGAPGTGKTYTARQVAYKMTDDTEDTPEEESHIASVQFHPGYDYSDFVVGMKPVLLSEKGKELERKNGKYVEVESRSEIEEGKVGNAQVSFRWKDGIFKKFAEKAKADSGHPYVFLIDEINRADLSRVFGELFSLLEEDYRYPTREKGITLPDGEEFVIPKNLYIIGTMNDIDRSVESMDFALRRRFAWFEVKPEDPDSEKIDAIIQAKVDDKQKIPPEDAKKLDSAMKALNKLIAPPQKKGEGGNAQKTGDKPKVDLRLGSEYQLGGAIFAKFEKYAGGKDPFGELWRNHIENILKEYLRGRSNRDDLLKELKDVYETSVGIATGTKEPA